MTGGYAATILALLFGYLCGSVPFGLLLTWAAGLGDVRSIGSGNIGATNVLRTGNKGLAAATLLLDAIKGTAAVLVAAAYDPILALPAGFGAFVGHLYPVWLGFKGGKGVATYLGVLIAIAWKAALVFAAVWLAVAFAARYSSLAALVACIAVSVFLYFAAGPLVAGVIASMTLIIFWKHKANIERLLAGTETKIGAKG